MTTTPTSGAADLPEALTVAVDCWFAKNTGLGGCSDKDVRELADIFRLHALAAGQSTAAQPGVVYAELPVPNYPKSGGFPGTFAEAQMHAFADATCALRASHGQAPAKPDPAYSAACHLATALFKKHFAHLPDFASGQAVWSLCGSTAGVISQIDNMVSGLVQPPATAFSEDEL